ncbi:MAG: RNA polymerase sigma-70 factor (ECF subfamily) [Cocleimonas sp.]|jgi:RNA polymerase sigma-70 factor (ECF subfamily)
MSNAKTTFNSSLLELLPRLKRYATVLAVIPESRDDLLQSTLERAIKKQDQWQQGSHLDRWLFTIMSSIWKNEIRSRVVRQGNGLSDEIDSLIDTSAENKRERTFLYEQVFKEVMLLPENQREAILLVYIEGLKYQQAADVLEIPLGTLMSRLARARVSLAGQFDEQKSISDDVNNTNDKNIENSVIQLNERRG